jgi:hypothetical protein
VAHGEPFGLLRSAVPGRAARRDRDRSVRRPRHRGAHCRHGDSCPVRPVAGTLGPGPQWDWRFEADLVTSIWFLSRVRRPPGSVGALAGRGGHNPGQDPPPRRTRSPLDATLDSCRLRRQPPQPGPPVTVGAAESLAWRARRRSMGRANVCGLSKNGRGLTSAFGARAGWPRGPRRCLHGSHEPWRTTASG